MLSEAKVPSDSIAHEKEHNVNEQSIQLDEFQSNVNPRRYVEVTIMEFLSINVFGAHVPAIVGMESLRFLVVCPLIMVEILYSPRLVIRPCLRRVSIHILLSITAPFIDPMLYIICLPSNRVREHFICLVDPLEHLCGLRTTLGVEIGVVLLGQLIVGKLDVFVGGRCFDLQESIQVVIIFAEVEDYGAGV